MSASHLAAVLAATWISGCATYVGTGVSIDVREVDHQPGWTMVKGVPPKKQKEDWDCGIVALAMVLEYWKVTPDAQITAKVVMPAAESKRAIRAGELRDLAKAHGLQAFLVEGQTADLSKQLSKGRPLIVGMEKPTVGGTNSHYEVVIGVNEQLGKVMTIDPGGGYRENSLQGFTDEWRASGSVTIIVAPKEGSGMASTAPSRAVSSAPAPGLRPAP